MNKFLQPVIRLDQIIDLTILFVFYSSAGIVIKHSIKHRQLQFDYKKSQKKSKKNIHKKN
ncbi:hypothetical protein A9Q98_15080 [Thalassotalea sp. 42_200_T64]|nr:hypothetical protein A9Q98_15080 [Thalassotalea sp. 42_200_T64]